MYGCSDNEEDVIAYAGVDGDEDEDDDGNDLSEALEDDEDAGLDPFDVVADNLDNNRLLREYSFLLPISYLRTNIDFSKTRFSCHPFSSNKLLQMCKRPANVYSQANFSSVYISKPKKKL